MRIARHLRPKNHISNVFTKLQVADRAREAGMGRKGELTER